MRHCKIGFVFEFPIASPFFIAIFLAGFHITRTVIKEGIVEEFGAVDFRHRGRGLGGLGAGLPLVPGGLAWVEGVSNGWGAAEQFKTYETTPCAFTT